MLYRCERCGTPFQAPKRKGRRYCSRSCASIERPGRRTGENRPCASCGQEFYVRKHRLAGAQTCSKECWQALLRTRRQTITCQNCGKVVEHSAFNARIRRFCSHECSMEARAPTIERYHNGKKARVHQNGYVSVWEPKDSIRHGWALEHRVVMEQVLGRKLKRDEHVHHINGKRADNRPENLIVLGIGEHISLTSKATQARFRKERVELAEYRKRFGPLE